MREGTPEMTTFQTKGYSVPGVDQIILYLTINGLGERKTQVRRMKLEHLRVGQYVLYLEETRFFSPDQDEPGSTRSYLGAERTPKVFR